MYYISHVVIISRKSLIPLKAIFSLRFGKWLVNENGDGDGGVGNMSKRNIIFYTKAVQHPLHLY